MEIEKFLGELSSEFAIRVLRDVDYFLDIRVRRQGTQAQGRDVP